MKKYRNFLIILKHLSYKAFSSKVTYHLREKAFKEAMFKYETDI